MQQSMLYYKSIGDKEGIEVGLNKVCNILSVC